jgi:putative tricarboxylic transport membrane protein
MSVAPQGTGGAGPSHRTVEIAVGALIAALGVVTIAGSLRVGINWGAEGPKSGFFPFYIGVLIVLASAINIFTIFREGGRPLFAEWAQLRQVLSVVAPTAVYVLILPYIGIYIASTALIALFMRWLGRYRWPLTAAVALGVPVAVYFIFERWFLVPLPKGPLEEWLGL